MNEVSNVEKPEGEPAPCATPCYAANREQTLQSAKDRMRRMAENGYYPAVQISGPPMVTASESIDD